MAKKKPDIDLAGVEDDLSSVMEALGGTSNSTKPTSTPASSNPTDLESGGTARSGSAARETRRKKPGKKKPSSTNETPPLPGLSATGLTSDQLEWFFTSYSRESGSTQVRLSNKTKEAIFHLAQLGGGIPGGQLVDNIVKWFITTNLKELKKFIKRDPLDKF